MKNITLLILPGVYDCYGGWHDIYDFFETEEEIHELLKNPENFGGIKEVRGYEGGRLEFQIIDLSSKKLIHKGRCVVYHSRDLGVAKHQHVFYQKRIPNNNLYWTVILDNEKSNYVPNRKDRLDLYKY